MKPKERDENADWGELCAGLVLTDPVLFRLFFFGDEYKLEPTREQLLMMADRSPKVLLCTGRKVSKTVILESEVLYLLVNNIPHEGGVDEALFFTPGDAHLNPFVERVMSRIDRTPILKALEASRERGSDPKIEFATGLRFYFRIEGMSNTDRNMVGLRARYVIGDELAFGGWVQHNSRIQTAMPNARWVYAGVPNGVRTSPFWALDQTSLGENWSRHKYPTYINPLYGRNYEKSRAELVAAYGGENTHGYLTQVLGEWGEETRSSFPRETIAVHGLPYFRARIAGSSDDSLYRNWDRLGEILAIPATRAHRAAIGWDYGYSPDPSVIFLAVEREPNDWYVYCGITLERVHVPHQVAVVRYLMARVCDAVRKVSCDNVACVQLLQSEDYARPERYLLSQPGGSVQVPLSGQRTEYFIPPESAEEALSVEQRFASVGRKEHYTNLLREWMSNAVSGAKGTKLRLGDDQRVISELISTTEKKSGTRTVYIPIPDPERRGSYLDHNTDALRFLCHAIQEAGEERENDEGDELAAEMGWAGRPNGWKAVWIRTT